MTGPGGDEELLELLASLELRPLDFVHACISLGRARN